MDGFNNNADGNRHTDSASHEPCMRQVPMKDLGMRCHEPALKPDPAARVGQAMPHLEAEKGNVVCGKRLRGATAVPGERDDGRVPTTLSHADCEVDDLPLGSTDAVDGGYEVGNVHQRALPARMLSIKA